MIKIKRLVLLLKLLFYSTKFRRKLQGTFKKLVYPYFIKNPSIQEIKDEKESEVEELYTLFNTEVMLSDAERSIVIVIPVLEHRSIFGGLATAFSFVNTLKKELGVQKLKVLYLSPKKDSTAEELFCKALADYTRNPEFSTSTEFISTQNFGTSVLSKQDLFVATFWTTAVFTNELLNKVDFDQVKFFYLIQDYEPNFYSWSDNFAFADNTYRMNIIPIFNTSLLADYVQYRHPYLKKDYTLKPMIEFRNRQKVKKSLKPIKVLVYGRPTKERNLFGVLTAALRYFNENFNSLSKRGIRFISIGEEHSAIEIGKGEVLKSIGKLSFDQYQHLLQEVNIGISLMLSPHPSYPPFDMAANGVQVITNKYRNKDLNLTNIHSVVASPVAIATKLNEIFNTLQLEVSCLQEEELDFLGQSIIEVITKIKLNEL